MAVSAGDVVADHAQALPREVESHRQAYFAEPHDGNAGVQGPGWVVAAMGVL